MRNRVPLTAAFALGLAVAASAEPPKATADTLARGKYLVEQAGQCQDCHTPRNEKGQFVKEQWLLGSELTFKPTVPMPWLPVAPPIAGLPTLTHDQAVHFLMTGERPGQADGHAADARVPLQQGRRRGDGRLPQVARQDSRRARHRECRSR